MLLTLTQVRGGQILTSGHRCFYDFLVPLTQMRNNQDENVVFDHVQDR
jgi:hypothetical protein